MTHKKKIIIKISIWLLVGLLLCTVISRSIYTILLPEVETFTVDSGTLSTTAKTTGRVGYTDKVEMIAKGDFQTKEVFVKEGDTVVKGAPLFSVDTSSAELEVKRLELAVVKLQNQLNPEVLAKTDGQRVEIEAQLKVAERELAMYEKQVSEENSIEVKKLNINIAQLENQLESYYVTQDSSADLRDGVRREKNVLAKMIAAQKSTAEIEEQKKLVESWQDNLEFYFTTHERERTMVMQLEMAQNELALYIKNQSDAVALKQEQLELEVLKLQNQLKEQPVLTKQQESELASALSVAKLELELQLEGCPKDGKFIAAESGIVTGLTITQGDDILSGQTVATILSEQAKPCIEWELGFVDGGIYEVGEKALVDVEVVKNGQDKQEKRSVIITKRELDKEKNQWSFAASFEEEVLLKDNTIPKISLSKVSGIYNTVVPLACVIPVGSGEFAVQMLDKRQGLFSEETVIREVKVEVLDKNNLYAAISNDQVYSSMKIVLYASKAIREGSVVSVMDVVD